MESDKNYCRQLFKGLCAACFMGLFLSCANVGLEGYMESVACCDSLLLSINELLFDPIGQGADYVEVVNVSDHTLDLSCYSIHNRNSKGVLGKGCHLSDTLCLLYPGKYCLLTSDTASVAASYGIAEGCVCLQMESFPSMPNAGGTVVLTDTSGCVVDECTYTPTMHHPLLSDREGVALEKLNPSLSSAEVSSWASAAADVAYGTPGKQNSQFRPYLREMTGGFYIPRAWLAPSSDDSTAFLTLIYRDVSAYLPVVNIEVYSRYGQKVATLVDNGILGVNGLYTWYGIDNQGNCLPPGQYIIRTQIYDFSGNTIRQTYAVQLRATRLRILRSSTA